MKPNEYKQLLKKIGSKAKKSKNNKVSSRDKHGGFASGYEQEFNNYLKLLLMSKQISNYEYEPLRFVMCTKPKATYKPDFIVVNPDGSVLVIEVKGFLRPEARERFLWAASCNLDKRFVMIGKKSGKWHIIYDVNQQSASMPLNIG